MARIGVYRVSSLASYLCGDEAFHHIYRNRCVDRRSFHQHGSDTGFPYLLGYNKQERPPVVDLYFYKSFTYNFKLTTDKQASNL